MSQSQKVSKSIIRKLGSVFYGWWIVAASFILFTFVGGTTFYGFTAFFNPIVTEMGWTRAQTSLAFSLRSVEGGIVQPIIGFLVDRIGPRKCIFVGVLITGTALLLMSRINSLPSFYGTFLMLALGATAALGIPEYAAIANWFRRRRALTMGILSAGFGLSGVMTPILVLLIHTYNWRITMVVIGILIIAIGVPLSLVVRHKPEQYGYLPDGEEPRYEVTQSADSGVAENGLDGVAEKGLSVKQALRTRTYWLLMLMILFPGFSMSAIMVHEMPVLISVGISENLAGLTMLGITISSLIGRLGFSWLGDTYDKRYLLAIACALQTIGVFIFANINTPWMIVPFLLTFGPGYGAQIPLLPAIQADYFGIKAFASLQGLFAVGWMIPGIIAPFLAGWLYDVRESYNLAFTIFAFLCSFAILAILSVKPVRTGSTIPRQQAH